MIATRLTKALCAAALTASLCVMLEGCPLVVVGAAGGGALMATDRRSVGAQTEDREIQAKTQSMFIGDMPDEAHMDVTVFNRRVLLTGEVPTPEAKAKAEAITRTIDNVQGIINELTVGPPSSFTARSNDAYITSKVKAALFTEKDLGSNFFKVVTEGGRVYLMGLVTPTEGDRGADAASRVTGVVQVVKVFQYITPEEAQRLSLGTPPSPDGASGASGANAPAPVQAAPAPEPDAGVTTGAVPDGNVQSQSIDQKQAPAPVMNSSPVQPGNPNKTQ
ncbi:BON domain-containing protein [Pararobbsia silviterrae]|uniref:BON domain-containing protein n=1 Tax=Pararobbsia silviterrae TaxID=1792498 RepID=A0A494XA25_9BURK|nr:BON domain-containing protein [Pararobbsia silviterrae]RKP45306.1 BON domain-containing protein [Pararobbsia silviterrae]